MKSPRRQKTNPTIRFRAKLLPTLLTLPKKASLSAQAGTKLPTKGKTMIEGTINTIPFRAALTPDKRSHSLKVNKAMREIINADTGDTVKVEITRVADEPETRVPADLLKALKATPSAQKSWTEITPLARRDWIFSICEAKLAETRKRRIEKACDMLASGKRRLCCFPGVKWVMKENTKTFGMWLPLPKSKK